MASRTPRRPPTPSLVLGLAMALLVAAVLAAADTRAGAQGVKEGGTLVIGTAAFDFVDPALVLDPSSVGNISAALAQWAVADATCATLLRYPVGAPTRQDYSLVPEVAAGYPAVSRDGKTYTFTIRTGYRFSTGAAVTAANYARAINRVLHPAMDSPAARYLQEVVGVKAAGKKLVVRLAKRVPDFPARMTMPYLCPVPKALPITPEGVGAPLPGSGPYYIAHSASFAHLERGRPRLASIRECPLSLRGSEGRPRLRRY